MSAPSEFFIAETVMKMLYKEHPELEEEVDHIEPPSEWLDIHEESQFPEKGKADVWGANKRIGHISWLVKFEIFKGANRRAIFATPQFVVFERDEGEEVTVTQL